MAEALRIIQPGGLALAAVMARKGVDASTIGERLGLTPPTDPTAARNPSMTLIGTGPGTWLAVGEAGQGDWVAGLEATLAGIASVSDQSSGYVVLRFSGQGAGALLQKGAFIDLDPAAFAIGAAATTVIGHLGVILWKVDDAPSFDVALFRSYAKSFQAWIAANAGGQALPVSIA
ncbi:MAG TPA: sarcosine oxidase subunit gamma family protein [Caulobacteraceae bacterium]|nr:sarcosine oxidase subunit gamma family protein [Caulobacteraceae bacterium]